MLILATAFYHSANDERNKEIEFCLEKNIENEHIDKILLFLEDADFKYLHKRFVVNKKVLIASISGRFTFFDAFNFLHKYLNDYKSDRYLLVSNSDIFFDNSIALTRLMGSNDCYCLSRIDYAPGNPESFVPYFRNDSQDAWVLKAGKGKLIAMMALNADCLKIPLGIPGCDNAIAHVFANDFKFDVSNPCHSIAAFHYHKSNYRTYIENKLLPVPPPYQLVEPCHLTNHP